MKLQGTQVSNEQAYDILERSPELTSDLEATPDELERFVTYSTLRAHHDHLRALQAARGGR